MASAIPGYSILPALAADVPTIADHVRTSKLSLSVNRFLYRDWPNEEAQSKQYAKGVKAGFEDPNSETLKVVEESSGTIVGHLVITHKNAPKETSALPPSQADARPGIPDYLVPEVLSVVSKAVEEAEAGAKGVEHLCLTHIHVVPSSRRKGIGTALTTLCIEKGKQASLPVFVSTEPQARPFFEKLGFRDTSHGEFDLRQFAPENCGYGVFRLSGMTFEE